ncbi:MAG: L,D-transpeptidase family protein [Gammaproteobacteria bacterium]
MDTPLPVRSKSARRGRALLSGLCALVLTVPVTAGQLFDLAADAQDVVGELSLATTVYEDTLSDLARAYDQGYNEMRLANPAVDPWLPGEGTEVVVPNLYVLPDAPRRGIVVNVPEMRMYYFLDKGRGAAQRVMTFPISIGRQNWTTPKGQTRIVAKVKDPAWYPPKSIREEHAAEGDILPQVVPAGPDNPLGEHALRLSIDGYLIHGTNKPYGIGMRVTHGCIRMYPKDVATVFGLANVGTPVHIVNQPYKVGIAHGRIYLEVHPHLEEDGQLFADQYSHVMELVLARVRNYDAQLVWGEVRRALESRSGIPHPIGSYRAKKAVRLDAPLAAGASPG